jgi:FkbM family methyltransferase
MKNISGLIFNTVIKTRSEEFLVHLRRKVNVLRQLVPLQFRHKFPSVGSLIPASAAYSSHDSYELTRDNTRFKINRSDYVQWRLFYGVRDNALKEAKKHVKENTVVLDIGSNFGAFSLKLATFARDHKTPGFRIHSFEPNQLIVGNFNHNLSLNSGAETIVSLHPYGLGSATTQQSFSVPASNTGAGRIVPEAKGQFKVPVKRLDDFISEIKPEKIGFIKMIAEGYEPEIFAGAWKTIKDYKPPIFFEVTPSWWEENNGSLGEVLDKLRALGYSFAIEHYNEMVAYQEEKFTHRTQFNILATIR